MKIFNNYRQYFFYMFIIIFCLIFFGNKFQKKKISADPKKTIREMSNILDLAKEADSKGFKISHIKQKIFASFDVIAGGNTIARIPVPLYGQTQKGAVYLSTILPAMLPKGEAAVYIWLNGREKLIAKGESASKYIDAQVALYEGENYLAVIIKIDNRVWGRSRVLRIKSPGSVLKDCENLSLNDFTKEAKNKRYKVPDKKFKCFPDFTLSAKGSVLAELPEKYEGKTTEGVIMSHLTLPKKTPRRSKVYIWNNGLESLVQKNASSLNNVFSKVVLAPGENYICAVIKTAGGRFWGRTPLVKIKSSVRPSIARFELSWDGPGDVDLHLQSIEKNIHVSYRRKAYMQNGYEINLDVDNTRAFGPENIRLYSIQEPTKFRCFLNYYSGRSKLKIIIRQFDKDNKLIKTYKKVFTRAIVRSTARFNNKSQVIGEFTVNP